LRSTTTSIGRPQATRPRGKSTRTPTPGLAITIDERFCRGDWGAPKSDASNATIAVNPCVVERINRLKLLTVEVRAGHAVRNYRVVKSHGTDDLVFQSVKDG
jgi:hypothetical protein